MIGSGDVELIAGSFPDPPGHMVEERLFEEDFVCAARRDHPDFGPSLGRDGYLAAKHIHVSLAGEPLGYVDGYLRRQGLARDIVVTVGHFLMAPMLLARTDAIATEPRRIMEPLAGRLGLHLAPTPIRIPPFSVVQVWHRRFDSDPGHCWLREILRDVASL